MIERKGKKSKGIKKPVKKKDAGGWFSPDSFMGKALCILLVIILTVGAFLAPKMIANLYDANTLMQITYTDMDLSTYVVAYTSFSDKIMAIARARTAGDRLMTLSVEEAEDKISDAELVQIVDQEIEKSADGLAILFMEGWWRELTDENLVSKEKNTLYTQPQRNESDNGTWQEMTPIQFWVLTFEITDEQRLEYMHDRGELSATEREAIRESEISGYATDRLIVCLDADFYKIYAVAAAGKEKRIRELYGWNLAEIFDAFIKVKSGESVATASDYNADVRMFMTDQIVEGWAKYWEVTPEDKNIYMNIQGEASGCMAFWDDMAEEEENEAESASNTSSASNTAGTLNASGTSNASSTSGTSMDAEPEKIDKEVYDVEAYEEYYVDSVKGVVYYGSRYARDENEILLEVGSRGEWDETDDTITVWIQKIGCRDFFDMMQF